MQGCVPELKERLLFVARRNNCARDQHKLEEVIYVYVYIPSFNQMMLKISSEIAIVGILQIHSVQKLLRSPVKCVYRRFLHFHNNWMFFQAGSGKARSLQLLLSLADRWNQAGLLLVWKQRYPTDWKCFLFSLQARFTVCSVMYFN